MNYTLDWLRANPEYILFETVSGSHAYGTATPTSDRDIRGIFILPEEAIFGLDYVEQINDEKNDIVFYEIRRFLELTASNNPTILELLNAPEDCIVKKHPLFDLIVKEKDKFITKICKNSFGGYAKQQITKARGLNKKQNWEQERMERKTVLDFCYVPQMKKNSLLKFFWTGQKYSRGQGSMSAKSWLKLLGYKQENCGLVAIPHMRYTYALFYDKKKKYKGIVNDEATANDIALTSIPDKNAIPATILQFNKDSYTIHCTDYKSYLTWLDERNVQRWTDVKAHGQMIDGKNMLHCRRLLEMAREIAEGKGIIVRRSNADELLKIRKGEVPLADLIQWAEKEIIIVDELFTKSTLPEEVDREFVNNLLVKIRKEFDYSALVESMRSELKQ